MAGLPANPYGTFMQIRKIPPPPSGSNFHSTCLQSRQEGKESVRAIIIYLLHMEKQTQRGVSHSESVITKSSDLLRTSTYFFCIQDQHISILVCDKSAALWSSWRGESFLPQGAEQSQR